MLHRFKGETENQELENILYLSFGTELMKAGISSTRTGSNFDYTLFTRYNDQEGIVLVHCELTRLNSVLARTEFKLRIDYDMSKQLAPRIHQLLQMADIQSKPSMHAEITDLFPHLSPNMPESPQQENADIQNNTERASEAEDNFTDGSQHRNRITKDRDGSPVNFILSTGITGFVIFGEVTEYFHYGSALKINAAFTWPGEQRSLSVGIDTSGNRVFNDEGVSGGPLYLSTAGISMEIGTGDTVPYRISGGLSIGAAVLTVAGPQDTLSKTVPYGGVKAHALFPIGNAYSIGGEIGFRMIFDTDVWIPSAGPSLLLRKEF